MSLIKRASSVLESFGPDRQTLSLAELISRTGLPRSTTHRIAEELAELGWLAKTPQGYQLGMRMFEFGELVPVQRNLSQVALPHMEDLRTATGASVHLAVLDGTEVVYLQVLAAKQAPPMNSRRGGRLPAHVTGVGKAMLAYADPEHVRHILLNLVANALKFTPRGEVRMRATSAMDSIFIAVEDTGIGIPADAQPGLFQPFVQVDGSSTRQFGGTGLGLAISRKLAEGMGGTLDLFSAGQDQGSTFTIRLPLWTGFNG